MADADWSRNPSNQNKCHAFPTRLEGVFSGVIKLSGERNTRLSTEEHHPAELPLLGVTAASNRSCQCVGTRPLRNIKHGDALRLALPDPSQPPTSSFLFARPSLSVCLSARVFICVFMFVVVWLSVCLYVCFFFSLSLSLLRIGYGYVLGDIVLFGANSALVIFISNSRSHVSYVF